MASPKRYISTISAPGRIKPVKLIVLSAPRCGTKALYHACRELGFTPYHMAETFKSGIKYTRIMNEAFDGENGDGKRFTREDFDKWFADYDIIIEMPFFSPKSIINAYPEAQFLLVERDPTAWARSCENTIFRVSRVLNSFPMMYLKYLIPQMYWFAGFVYKLEKKLTGGKMSSSGGGGDGTEERRRMEEVEGYYREYSKLVKSLIPPAQLHVLRLEDPVNKYGWETICPILGVPVPENTPWPSSNDTEAFKSAAKGMYVKVIGRGVLMAGFVVVFVAGVVSLVRSGGFRSLLILRSH